MADEAIPASRICTKCSDEKLLIAFGRHVRGRFGRSSVCLDCSADQKRITYDKLRPEILERRRERYAASKQQNQAVATEKPQRDGEVWRAVGGYEGLYEVSSEGRVWSVPHEVEQVAFGGRLSSFSYAGGIRAADLNQGGYPALTLWRQGKPQKKFSVHDLVCTAFHGPRPAGLIVAHGNGIKTDNRAENLRWATPSENMEDQRKHGTLIVGENHRAALLTEELVREIRASPLSGAKAAVAFGTSATNISRIRNRVSWKHVD
jgi:hypothetical protein